jgi:hypothetical protein
MSLISKSYGLYEFSVSLFLSLIIWLGLFVAKIFGIIDMSWAFIWGPILAVAVVVFIYLFVIITALVIEA